MKTFILILISIHGLICSFSQKQIDYTSIKVIRVGQHPFLPDHCKKLITEDKNGKLIDEAQLYCDPGSGCNSYLFEVEKEYILIDCNGHWFKINKITGQIENEGWKWNEELPDSIIGSFKKVSDQIDYKLELTSKLTKEDVYKFKDPK